MNLVAFADESGTHDDTGQEKGADVAGVVGYISEKEAWANFCGEWKDVLDHYAVKIFQMSEFADEINGPNRPDWPYHGWRRDKKERFIRELVPIARDNTMFAVGCFVDVKAHYRSIPSLLKTGIDKPYHVCFQGFFDILLATIRQRLERPLDPGEQITFFFGQQDEYEPRAIETFDQVKRLRDSEDRMGKLSFASTEKYPCLQAADLIAYRMRKLVSRKLGGKPVVSEGSWDEELESRHNLIIGYLEGGRLQPIMDKVVAARLEAIEAAIKKIE